MDRRVFLKWTLRAGALAMLQMTAGCNVGSKSASQRLHLPDLRVLGALARSPHPCSRLQVESAAYTTGTGRPEVFGAGPTSPSGVIPVRRGGEARSWLRFWPGDLTDPGRSMIGGACPTWSWRVRHDAGSCRRSSVGAHEESRMSRAVTACAVLAVAVALTVFFSSIRPSLIRALINWLACISSKSVSYWCFHV